MTPIASAPAVSVIIPTHNPHAGRLQRTLGALASQTLAPDDWELIGVDNASHPPLDEERFEASGPARGRIMHESVLGLTAARRRGLQGARGEFCVFVDDDNVLAPDYLENVLRLFQAHPRLGAIGGPSQPEFESAPPAWAAEFFPLLALRDLGPAMQLAELTRAHDGAHYAYPACAPIGAGMALRKTAVASWLQSHTSAAFTDRCGTALTSGGDNDIVLSILRAGWQVGYFPELKLTHLIPPGRTTRDYLARLNYGVQRSWMQVLSRHQANPWPPLSRTGCVLRQIRAWLVHRGWSSPAAYVRWRGACGHFAGRSQAIVQA